MAKKIYDIFPPNCKLEIKPSPEGYKETKTFSSQPSSKRFTGKIVLIVSALAVALILSYFFLLRVDIDIWPETEAVDYSGTIEVRSGRYHYDINEGIIPGKLFTVEIEKSKTFSASGRLADGSRAEGILRVYNNHSANPQTLVIETRFVSAEGKLFRSTEAVSVPGKSGSTPGHADVRVRAVEAGEGYNINKGSKFSIPGLQGTPMYANIYAENLEPITGGFIGESPVITADDVEIARKELLSAITKEAKTKMTSSAPEFVFDEETMDITVVAELVKPEVGGRYESFNYFLKIKAESFTFKRADIEGFLKDILLSGLNEEGINSMFSGKKILDKSLSFEYKADMRGVNDGSMMIEIKANALAYPVIREDLIKNKIAGMSVKEASMALIDHERTAEVKVIPRPSWLRNIPSSNRIRINVRFDER